MRAEQAHQAGGRKRLDDEHVRRRGVGVHRHGARGCFDLLERVDQPVRRARDGRAAGVGVELARPGNRRLNQHRGNRREDDRGDERDRTALPAIVAPAAEKHREAGDHHDRGGQRCRHRAREDVAVLHVRELVRQHAVELVVAQDLQDAFGGRHGRMLRVPARGKRIRRAIRDHVAAGLRQAGSRREALHAAVQPVVRSDFGGPIHLEHDRVREPVGHEVGDDGEEETEDQSLGAAQGFSDEQQQRAQRAEQQCGLERV